MPEAIDARVGVRRRTRAVDERVVVRRSPGAKAAGLRRRSPLKELGCRKRWEVSGLRPGAPDEYACRLAQPEIACPTVVDRLYSRLIDQPFSPFSGLRLTSPAALAPGDRRSMTRSSTALERRRTPIRSSFAPDAPRTPSRSSTAPNMLRATTRASSAPGAPRTPTRSSTSPYDGRTPIRSSTASGVRRSPIRISIDGTIRERLVELCMADRSALIIPIAHRQRSSTCRATSIRRRGRIRRIRGARSSGLPL